MVSMEETLNTLKKLHKQLGGDVSSSRGVKGEGEMKINNKKENRKRAPNFSSKEEAMLVALAKKYKGILECKQTDMKSHAEKAACWRKIVEEYNSNSGEVYRPQDVLRKKYENIKKRVKKKYADEKCYALGTGGGPSRKSHFTPMEDEIKEMLGKRIEGHTTEFGGDALVDAINSDEEKSSGITPELNSIRDSITDNEILMNEQENDEEIFMLNIAHQDDQNQPWTKSPPPTTVTTQNTNATSTVANNWTNYTPQMLRQQKAPALSTKKKESGTPIRDRVSQWAEIKSQIEISKQKYVEKEQELKLQCFREKHDLELSLMRQKAQLEMDNEKNEHRLRVEILELSKQKMLNEI